MTKLERYDPSRAPMLWPLKLGRRSTDKGNEKYKATWRGARRFRFDEEYRLKKAAWKRRKRLALLRKIAPWLLVGLVASAAFFVDWEAVAGRFVHEESAQVLMFRLFEVVVMIDETTWVLLAFGSAGLLGIFLLFQRIRRGLEINRILRAGTRPARKGWTVRLKGPFARKDKAVEQTFRNVFFTAANRGEGLIEHYMTRHKCGRTEAMKRAIEERERDERRYG